MRLFDTLLAILGALGLLALGAWSYLDFPERAKAYETTLGEAVTQRLESQGIDWVTVEMDGQTARLSGASGGEENEARAIATALSTLGEGGPVFGAVTSVETDFDAVETVSPFTWRATRNAGGEVILDGYVPGEVAQAALVAAAETAGASSVEDRARIARGAPDGAWTEAATVAVASVAELDAGSAVLEDTELRVSGIAMDNTRRARLSAEVANVPAPFIGKPDIRGPSKWSARHADGALVLEGEVASESERQEVFDIAETHFSGTVVDEMRVAGETYAGWLDGVRLGLPQFAKFTSGFMGFDPEGVGFVFAGEAPGSVLSFLREDLASLGGAYAVEIDTREVAVTLDEVAGIDFDIDPRGACEAAFASVLETNDVVFESGEAEISRASGETLDKLMAVSGQCAPNLVFELGGHTDSIGERAFNVYLSEIRAQAVADYMVARGFDADRLTAVGYGPDQPKSDNATPEGRLANRRIEIKVLEQSEQ
ncbi:MAG: OmpA family protein [Pseudomonadota bacterium]